jgi:hypothetical protein
MDASPMNIHFASLFGVDFDMDLFPFWTQYYLSQEFDSYTVFLHRERGNVPLVFVEAFRGLGFEVELYTNCSHGNGFLRKYVFENFVKKLPPNDFIVTADADEFQRTPNDDPPKYREILRNYDCMVGFMQDYYEENLNPCVMDPFLQYPFKEEFTKEVLKNFTPPFLRASAWPLTRRTKILACPVSYKLAYMGSHCFYELGARTRILEDCHVAHFAWRESARLKTAVKTYYTKENLNEMFGGNVPEPIREKFVVLCEEDMPGDATWKNYKMPSTERLFEEFK